MSAPSETVEAIPQATEVPNRLPLRLAFGWGLGTLGVSVLFNATNILLLRFLTDYAGLAATLAGLAIAVSKIYDAVTDPVMGVISDRTRSRWGRRRPYLFLGGLLCGAAFVLLFYVPAIPGMETTFSVVLVLMLIYATAYTVFNVPYLAMPAEMTDSYHERSFLMSFRVGFIGFGQLAAGFGGPLLVAYFGGGAVGHQTMALIMGGVIVLGCIGCFALTHDARQTTHVATTHMSLLSQLRLVAENRPFALLLLAKLGLLIGVAITASTTAFLTSRILEAPDYLLAQLIAVNTLGHLAFIPIWLRISRHIEKKTVYLISCLLFAAIGLTWLLADASEPTAITLLRGFASGASASGLLLMAQSFLPDTMEYDHLNTGLRREGVLAGFYTTIEKIAFALGTALTGLFLGAMGYVSGKAGVATEQPESAITAIYLCNSVLPAIFLGLSALAIAYYPLTAAKLRELRVASERADG